MTPQREKAAATHPRTATIAGEKTGARPANQAVKGPSQEGVMLELHEGKRRESDAPTTWEYGPLPTWNGCWTKTPLSGRASAASSSPTQPAPCAPEPLRFASGRTGGHPVPSGARGDDLGRRGDGGRLHHERRAPRRGARLERDHLRARRSAWHPQPPRHHSGEAEGRGIGSSHGVHRDTDSRCYGDTGAAESQSRGRGSLTVPSGTPIAPWLDESPRG